LRHRVEDFAGDVALETADGFGLGLSFGLAFGEVVVGAVVAAESDDDDPPESGVGETIAGAVESVSVGLAASGGDGVAAAERGKRGLGPHQQLLAAQLAEPGVRGPEGIIVALAERIG
jgi:hypothetical protein